MDYKIINYNEENLKQYNIDINTFNCGNSELDDFLKNKALKDLDSGKSVTKLVILEDNNIDVMAYYSLNCSSIIMNSHGKNNFSPAVEIKVFAMNNKYQHTVSKEDKDFTLSDLAFCKIIEEINNFSSNVCGAENIILYSVPKAVNFYKRNGFTNFEDYMIKNDERYLRGCEPMWLRL